MVNTGRDKVSPSGQGHKHSHQQWCPGGREERRTSTLYFSVVFELCTRTGITFGIDNLERKRGFRKACVKLDSLALHHFAMSCRIKQSISH